MPPSGDLSADLEALLADPEMAHLFMSEAREHLASIEATVLRLEQAPADRSGVDAIYRSFHTIKGNAYAIGARTVGGLAHEMESRLDVIRSGERPLGEGDVDVILETVDRLKAIVDDLARGLRPPTAPAALVASPDDHRKPEEGASIKVDTRRLDALVDLVGELAILQAMIRENCPVLSQSDQLVARQFASFGRLLSELQRLSLSMRMVPLGRTFQRIARVVRDASQVSGKPVDLVMAGETTELDRHVIEELVDPLMHLVRNAIDHGVEDAGTRARLGKPTRAELALCASHHDGQVCIEISDDGRGLDAAKIRAAAISRGLIGETDELSLSELHHLIFAPGFSTAAAVTDLSGRGVGMDVVQRNLQALGGRVDIRTTVDRGTTFSLMVPLTMAILKGVLLRAGHERFVLPAHVLREAVRWVDCEIHQGPGGKSFVEVRGITMPFVDLSSLLGGRRHAAADAHNVVLVIEVDGRRAALYVDCVFGVQEFVVKPLTTLDRVRGLAGGAVLGDGSVGLILDPTGLFALIDAAARAAA